MRRSGTSAFGAALLLLASFAHAQGLPGEPDEKTIDPPPSRSAWITVEGDTLTFNGAISESSWRELSALAASGATRGVTRMVVTSDGGETIAGRRIARWVRNNIDTLEIDGICFSSCANYIFPAAPRKIIRQDAFVGWHGSERTSEILALSRPGMTAGDVEREEMRQTILESEPELEGTAGLQSTIETWLAEAANARIDEARFFASLKVDDTITYFGLMPERLGAYEASERDGWTFSPEDMACFGIADVTYMGDGPYTQSPKVRANVNVYTLPDTYSCRFRPAAAPKHSGT